MLNLSKASGAKFSFTSLWGKIIAVIIPAILLLSSYLFFLSDYSFEDTTPLLVFLDFGYPLGQSLYVSLAVVTYFLTKKFLGGVMKWRVLFMIFALVFQYTADSTFLYQVRTDTWYAGSFSDYLFLVSYFFMSISLVQFLSVLEKRKG
jgi:hypothetical protein